MRFFFLHVYKEINLEDTVFSKVLLMKFLIWICIENKPKGSFVSGRFVPPDIMSPRTFSPLEAWFLWTFCPSRRFAPPDVLSHECYVSGRYDSGRIFSGRFVPPDVFLRTFCLGTRNPPFLLLICSTEFTVSVRDWKSEIYRSKYV